MLLALAGCMATAPKKVDPREAVTSAAAAPNGAEVAVEAHGVDGANGAKEAPPPLLISVPADAPTSALAPPPRAATRSPVTLPVARLRRPPAYPPELSEEGLQGEVILSFYVGEKGRPEDVRIERSSHPAFSKEVMAVVPGWRFEPARDADGRVVRTQMRVPLSFRVE